MSQDARYDTRGDSGRYTAKYDEEDILNAVREHEPAGTREVADAVGCVRQNADYRLRRLEDVGKVRSKKVGGALVWMLSSERSGRRSNSDAQNDLPEHKHKGSEESESLEEITEKVQSRTHDAEERVLREHSDEYREMVDSQ